MRTAFMSLVLGVAAGWAAAATPASAPAPRVDPAGTARSGAAVAGACQSATQQTLRDTRGAAASASFSGVPALVPGAADATEVIYRGSGQVRTAAGSRPFSYSCTYDTRSNAVAGVVVRDVGANEAAPAARQVEPDLSQVSPAACESAAAGALKRRWPAVARIHFNPDTRQFSQDAGGSASLRGQGTATPSAQAPATHFSYDCAIDPRNGRVVGMRIAD